MLCEIGIRFECNHVANPLVLRGGLLGSNLRITPLLQTLLTELFGAPPHDYRQLSYVVRGQQVFSHQKESVDGSVEIVLSFSNAKVSLGCLKLAEHSGRGGEQPANNVLATVSALAVLNPDCCEPSHTASRQGASHGSNCTVE